LGVGSVTIFLLGFIVFDCPEIVPICIRGRLLALFASSQSFGARLGAGKPRPLGFLVNRAAFGI